MKFLACAKSCLRGVVPLLIVWALYFARANIWFRLYPVVMVALALAVFAFSLTRVPLVERIARATGAQLSAQGKAYCRAVTQVWVGFLAVHLLVTIATLFLSLEVWALYNGCVSYLLMGTLFLGEWLVRRRMCRA